MLQALYAARTLGTQCAGAVSGGFGATLSMLLDWHHVLDRVGGGPTDTQAFRRHHPVHPQRRPGAVGTIFRCIHSVPMMAPTTARVQ